MTRTFIGVITVVFTSPHRLDKPERRALADQVTAHVIREISKRLNTREEIPLEAEVIYANPGCIIAKSRLFIKGTVAITVGLATALFAALSDSDFSDLVNQNIPCSLGGEAVTCRVLKVKAAVAESEYKSKQGDTVSSIVRDVFKIPEKRSARVIEFLTKEYKAAIINPMSGELKPGTVFAKLPLAAVDFD